MVPLNRLLAAAAPEPSKELLVPASRLSPARFLNGSLLTVLMPPLMDESRPALAFEAFCAEVFSTRLMVMVSPTRRARRSSNRGRVACAWKMAPLAGAMRACCDGRADIG